MLTRGQMNYSTEYKKLRLKSFPYVLCRSIPNILVHYITQHGVSLHVRMYLVLLQPLEENLGCTLEGNSAIRQWEQSCNFALTLRVYIEMKVLTSYHYRRNISVPYEDYNCCEKCKVSYYQHDNSNNHENQSY